MRVCKRNVVIGVDKIKFSRRNLAYEIENYFYGTELENFIKIPTSFSYRYQFKLIHPIKTKSEAEKIGIYIRKYISNRLHEIFSLSPTGEAYIKYEVKKGKKGYDLFILIILGCP